MNFLLTCGFALVVGAITPAFAQTAPASAGAVDPKLIEDLVAANRILAMEGILDG